MEFTDKYISQAEADLNPDAKKIVLSNDAYAQAEAMSNLVNEIRRRI